MSGMHLAFVARPLAALGLCVCMCVSVCVPACACVCVRSFSSEVLSLCILFVHAPFDTRRDAPCDTRRDAPFSTHDKHSKQDKHYMRRDAPFEKRRDAPFSTHDKHSKQDKHCMRRDAPLDKRYYALHYAYNYHYVIIISTIIIYHLSSSRMHLASVARLLAALGVCVRMCVSVCVCVHLASVARLLVALGVQMSSAFFTLLIILKYAGV